MERHGLLDDQFVRIEHLLRVVPARWVATATWAIDFSSTRAMPGISRYILGQKNGLHRSLRPGRDWNESLPSCLTCHEQPPLGRRHPVKPVSRRSRARDQREAAGKFHPMPPQPQLPQPQSARR